MSEFNAPAMPLMAYFPELKCAVEVEAVTENEKREQSVKAHICKCNRVDYSLIKRTADTMQMAAAVKSLLAFIKMKRLTPV